jgi:hypothetical protein
MMRRRSTIIARHRASVLMTVCCAMLASSMAMAQPADLLLIARADSITVGDYCAVHRNVLRQPTVTAAVADERTLIDAALDRVCDPRVAAVRLRELTGAGAATMPAVARLRQDAALLVSLVPLDTAMQILSSRLRSTELRPIVKAALGDSANAEFFRISDTPRLLFVREARDRALGRLARYARKLGPQSPKLNAIEVLLNYSAQRWVPGFAPSVERGPSPLEVIAAYVPAYGTVAGGRAVTVSSSEFGLRHYLFGPKWGATGWKALIRPAYVSAGAIVANDRSGAISWPWDGRSRVGGFVGWGETKVAYVHGRRGRFLVTRQVQFIPFAF